MTNRWDFYLTELEGRPASILLDMKIGRLGPPRGYDTMGYVRVSMRQPDDSGLASEQETPVLSVIEDALTAHVAARSPSLYVGRTTSGGFRDFVFYTRRAEAFDAAAAEAMEAFPDYRRRIGGEADPEWETYFAFLYPTAEQRQTIASRAALETLASHGDRTDIARRIDHAALFGEAGALHAFADFARENGFTIAPGHPPSRNGRLVLEFWRADPPAGIDAVTNLLVRAARDHGGKYDGWGCETAA